MIGILESQACGISPECQSVSQRGVLQAVILAAGEGQRLRPEGYLKPLTPVLGITLLERVILACSGAGVSECIVVLGYGKETIGERLDEFAARAGIAVRGVENPHWQEGNGTSALAAQPYVGGSFPFDDVRPCL